MKGDLLIYEILKLIPDIVEYHEERKALQALEKADIDYRRAKSSLQREEQMAIIRSRIQLEIEIKKVEFSLNRLKNSFPDIDWGNLEQYISSLEDDVRALKKEAKKKRKSQRKK